MKGKNLYKKYIIFLSRKVVLVSVLCLLLIMFLFTFSCNLNDDSKSVSGNDDTTVDDISSSGIEEESQGTGQDQDTDIDESPDTGEEAKDEEETKKGELTIYVYYSDAMGEYLVGEARVVSSENKYVNALNELMKLPVDSSLYRLVPESTKINSIIVEDGLAKVDLSQDFVNDKVTSDTEDNLLVYSIVNTLTEFPEVNSVSFYIDGEKLDTLGMLDISGYHYRRSDLIK